MLQGDELLEELKTDPTKKRSRPALKYILDHWSQLSAHRWRWEFIRRCNSYPKDPCPLLVDIWDLPHPGKAAVYEFKNPSYVELLAGICEQWEIEGKLKDRIVPDLLRFSAALGGKGFYYEGNHTLVSIKEYLAENSTGLIFNYERKVHCTVKLPQHLIPRWQCLLSRFESELPIIRCNYRKPLGAPTWHLTVEFACFRGQDLRQVKTKINQIARDILNEGFPKVIPWQRFRLSAALERQCRVIDVERGVRAKKSVLDEFGIDEGEYQNYRKRAKEKIDKLLCAAEERRKLLGVPRLYLRDKNATG